MFINIFKNGSNKWQYFIVVSNIFQKSVEIDWARVNDRPQNLHESITVFENVALALVLDYFCANAKAREWP